MDVTSYELLHRTDKSINELKKLGYTPVRIRMHPLDAEAIIAMKQPEHANKRLTHLFGLDVISDYDARLGEPVAEF